GIRDRNVTGVQTCALPISRFIALRLPYAVQSDEEDAQLALKFIEPDETLTIDVARATDGIAAEMLSRGIAVSDFNKGNIKARQRVVAHYALTGEWGLAVLGSDHARSEEHTS